MSAPAHQLGTRLHAWRPAFWEPVAGTGERLMVGVLYQFDGEIKATRILRDDVLDALYGQAAEGARRLIDTGLSMLEAIARNAGIEAAGIEVMGIHGGEHRATEANNVGELLRDAALLYSSLANIDALDDAKDSAPQSDEISRRFSTEIRELVVTRRPNLREYFGRSASIVEGGVPVRFGFCSPRCVVHFGVLHPVRQAGSVRDARSKLWEISRAMDLTAIQTGALVWAVPELNDPMLGERQREAIQRNRDEIEREADKYEMRFFPVANAEHGAGKLLQMA